MLEDATSTLLNLVFLPTYFTSIYWYTRLQNIHLSFEDLESSAKIVQLIRKFSNARTWRLGRAPMLIAPAFELTFRCPDWARIPPSSLQDSDTVGFAWRCCARTYSHPKGKLGIYQAYGSTNFSASWLLWSRWAARGSLVKNSISLFQALFLQDPCVWLFRYSFLFVKPDLVLYLTPKF